VIVVLRSNRYISDYVTISQMNTWWIWSHLQYSAIVKAVVELASGKVSAGANYALYVSFGAASLARATFAALTMKIAQVAPLYEAVPPRLYGGTERVAAHLTDALVRLGHEVTLFASAEAETSATLVPVRDQAIRLDPTPLKSDLAAHLAMLAQVRSRADEFDVIHFHTEMLHFPMFEDVSERTITTLHGRLDLKDLPEVYRRWIAYPLVSASDEQRKRSPSRTGLGRCITAYRRSCTPSICGAKVT
jgi:Glycosyltransferase Family 4